MSCQLVIAALACAALGGAIYLNTLQCGIVYDDEPAILKNKDLRPTSAWVDLLFHDFWGTNITVPSSHKSYRPICVATYRLNYLIHELEPFGYHLVNVLLHAFVCFLFVLLCGVVFCEVWSTLMAGALFAVHPIHTEAVSDGCHSHNDHTNMRLIFFVNLLFKKNIFFNFYYDFY